MARVQSDFDLALARGMLSVRSRAVNALHSGNEKSRFPMETLTISYVTSLIIAALKGILHFAGTDYLFQIDYIMIRCSSRCMHSDVSRSNSVFWKLVGTQRVLVNVVARR